MDINFKEYKLLYLAALTAYLIRMVHSVATIRMTNVDSYANKLPVSSASDTSMIVRSSLECVYQCYFMRSCDTTFYHKTSGICILMTTGAAMPQMIASTGFNMYKTYCADGGFFKAGSLCMRVILEMKSWNEERNFCQRLNTNAHLLNLQSTTKINTLDGFMGVLTENVTWIGGSDKATESIFKWTDGSRVNYTLFFRNVINNKDYAVNSFNADCLAYRHTNSRFVSDDDCSKALHEFICEVD